MRLASTKIAQPEPSRRRALLSRAVVPTSSAGVAESRSGPRNRAVRWKLPSLLRITPGATSAAHGRKSVSILGFLRYSARFNMASPLHVEMRGITQVSAHDLDELRVASCGPDRRQMADRPQHEAGDPKAQSQANGSSEGAVGDRNRARGTAEQDRLCQRPMHGRFEPRKRVLGKKIAHQTRAPPPNEKNDRKNELAANAIERPNTIWTRRRNPPDVSPKASVRPVKTMMITAMILATGPSIDCRICCSGCSQGMFEPAAPAGVVAHPRSRTARTVATW